MNKDEYYNGPCTRVFCPALAVNTGRLGGTGVQHDTRVDGPCRPAVNTGTIWTDPKWTVYSAYAMCCASLCVCDVDIRIFIRTSRLVFTARLRPQFRTPPVPKVPSSECPRASIAARRRAAGSIRISRRALCCCSSATAGIVIGANFKICLLRQFCSN